MADINTNHQTWSAYDWSRGGEEWSDAWGGSEKLWKHVLLPRIQSFVPAENILEIAPGRGRMTAFLIGLSKQLAVVDLVPECIDACKKRFAEHSHISYFVNDGRSLSFVPDNSLDFVFSFDSLVHAEADVMEAYVKELAKKLKPDGAGFIHHSNLGAYWALLNKYILGKPTHFRARSMKADLFASYCGTSGLKCIRQELINWGGDQLTDCLSTFIRPGSRFDRAYERTENPGFMADAARIAALPE